MVVYLLKKFCTGSDPVFLPDRKSGYFDAIVHAFRKFRAPLSGKEEHAFPVRVQEYKSIFQTIKILTS